MNVLLVGDIIGRPGRTALRRGLARLKRRVDLDFVVVNGENAAAGLGLTVEIAREILGLGVDVITTGNHIWSKKEITGFLDEEPRLLRPANYPAGAAGRGSGIYISTNGFKLGVVNLEGRTFMHNLDCPFAKADKLVEDLKRKTPVVLVDFHAETTSEKMALGYYLAGRVSLVAGTHTHVQTADERILAGGTGYITDLGMTGGFDSVIGFRPEEAIERFLTQRPLRLEVAKGSLVLNGVIAEIDADSGETRHIERVFEKIEAE
ncbi:MAG: TIGR00282 family metallophosphoesterase [Deltaproteobacteria bacterium]|nr:TIGR00282 family metallophosphoesterase [Deltaproteobacteria bacterium]